MKHQNAWLFNLMLIGTAFLWGVSFLWVKDALNAGLDSSFFLFLRYLLASLIWLPFCGKEVKKLTFRQVLMGLTVGFFLYAAMLVQTIALGMTTPSNSAFITTSYVVLTPFVVWALLRQKPQKKIYACAALCFLGLYVLTRVPGESFSLSFGDGLTLVSALLFALQMTFLYRFSSQLPSKVLTFLPQIAILFLFLSFLEDSGYMARAAFIMDRLLRRFGLSGKSFIPMLVGTGCGVPGVMASRTIENERDRRMTIMTTCFIPCGAKMPIIGLFAGALFGGSSWVATSAYFIGFAAIIISGIILKKTKLFAGDPAPFVMELPAYHVPAWGNVLRATWERGWSFIKRAGTVILASTIILWFLQGFGFENGAFTMVEDQDNSILAIVASAISWIFIPQGFGDWRATVASISGLIAKENVVGTFGVLYHFGGELSDNGDEIWPEVAANFTALSAYSFMIFNLLCAPCFAAMGAIKREMNNGKWTAIAIGYMCLLAYCASLVVYQIGGLITGEVSFNIFTIVAIAIIAFTIYLLFRPNKYEGVNEVQFDSKKTVASK